MSLVENQNPREHLGANHPPKTTAEELALEHAALLGGVDGIEARMKRVPKTIKTDVEQGLVAEVGRDAGALARKIDGVRKEEVEPHLTKQREINGFFASFADRLKAVVKDLEDRATAYITEKAAAERRAREAEARKAQEESDRQRMLAEKASEAGRDGKALLHEDKAEAASDHAWRANIAAQASTAELVRVRSATGAMATAKGKWDFAIEDLSMVPLEALRPYLGIDVIEKAIRAHVKANQDRVPLAGVRIFKTDKASFR